MKIKSPKICWTWHYFKDEMPKDKQFIIIWRRTKDSLSCDDVFVAWRFLDGVLYDEDFKAQPYSPLDLWTEYPSPLVNYGVHEYQEVIKSKMYFLTDINGYA